MRAYNYVGVGYVRGARLCKQSADCLSVRCIQSDYLRVLKLNHTPKAYLPGRIPDDLRESRSRNDNAMPILQSGTENREDATIISFERNQPASIENDSTHAALRDLAPRLFDESIFLAQARSFGLSGPPVSLRTCSTMARNSAELSKDLWTAC